MTSRREELAHNWQAVQSAVATACETAGRNFAEVQIIAVTKTWPASDVDLLAELGVSNVGENRDQEAWAKHSQVTATNLTWHAIGQIQSNKVKSIAQWADVVHSIDRPELIEAFAKALKDSSKKLDVFIQLNLDDHEAEHRGGATIDELLELAAKISDVPNLQLIGVMGVAPLDGDAATAFSRLQQASVALQGRYPEAIQISAGMSMDYEIALKYGATHLRIGSAILGSR